METHTSFTDLLWTSAGLNVIWFSCKDKQVNFSLWSRVCFPVLATSISCSSWASSDSSRTSGASETTETFRPGDPREPHRSRSQFQQWRRRHGLLRPPVSEERLLVSDQWADHLQDGEWTTNPSCSVSPWDPSLFFYKCCGAGFSSISWLLWIIVSHLINLIMWISFHLILFNTVRLRTCVDILQLLSLSSVKLEEISGGK